MPDCTSCKPTPRPLGLHRMRCGRCGACEFCCDCEEGCLYKDDNAEELGLDPILDRARFEAAVAQRRAAHA